MKSRYGIEENDYKDRTNDINLVDNTGIGGCLSNNMIDNLQILKAETDENPLKIIETTEHFLSEVFLIKIFKPS